MIDLPPLVPIDLDAERCLVHSMFLAGADAELIHEMRSMVRPEHFADDGHAEVWRGMCELAQGGKPMDLTLLRESAVRRGKWDDPIGGVDGIRKMLDAVPTAGLGPHYARIVRDKAVGRWIVQLGQRAIRRVQDPQGLTFAEIASQVERDFARLAIGGNVQSVSSIGEVLIDWWSERMDQTQTPYVPTGFEEVDDIIGGLGLGKFILIAARAHMGKSAFAKQLLLNIASAGTPCGIVSIEEDRRKIAANVTSNRSGVNNDRISHGTIAAEDTERIQQAVDGMYHLPVYVNDSAFRLTEIEAAATTMAVKHGARVIFVDHLHIADAEIDGNRERQVAHISSGLKRLGKRLGSAIVGLCQLNRGGGGADDYCRRPIVKDLRDSGALEADGDVILMLHREDYYRAQKGEHGIRDHKIECLIRKNKDGSLGDVPLYWDPDHQRIAAWNQPA